MCAVKEVAARYHQICAIGFRKADFRISDKISVGSHGLRLSIEKNKKDDDEMSEKLNSNKTITNAQQGTNKQLMKEKHNKHEKSMLVSVQQMAFSNAVNDLFPSHLLTSLFSSLF